MTKRKSAPAKNLARSQSSLEKLVGSLPRSTPRFIEPMKARLSENLPTSDEWVFEIKFDGFRGLALKKGSEARLISRNNRELGPKFPEILAALRKLPCDHQRAQFSR